MTLPLSDQHGGYWGEHPEHAVSTWQAEVANDETRQGYWDWVKSKLESTAEEAPGSLPWCIWISTYQDNGQWTPWSSLSCHYLADQAHEWARFLRPRHPADLFAVRPTKAGRPPRIPVSHV